MKWLKNHFDWLLPAFWSLICAGRFIERWEARGLDGLGWMGWSYLGMSLVAIVVLGLVLLGRTDTRNEG